MAGWYMYKTDRKTSIQLSIFLLIILTLTIIIRFIFTHNNGTIAGNSSNEEIRKVLNGKGKKAVLFIKYGGATVDNSLQVSILKENENLKNDDVGNVFSSDREDGTISKNEVIINWRSSGSLEILYTRKLRTFIKKSKFKGVTIFYKEVE